MNGREALEALERIVEARRVALRNNYNFADRPPALSDDCIGISLADLRAALASKEAGPLADHSVAPLPSGIRTPVVDGASAGGLAKRVHVVSPGHNWGSQMWSVVQDDGGLFCLTFYADSAEGGRAREVAELIARAVNALASKDAGPRKVVKDVDGIRWSVMVSEAEYERLRARDQWIEEHAKPALEQYSDAIHAGPPNLAGQALAALPQRPIREWPQP